MYERIIVILGPLLAIYYYLSEIVIIKGYYTLVGYCFERWSYFAGNFR
jgi:hypothetical protein